MRYVAGLYNDDVEKLNEKLELLAPAGSMEALHAAVCAGADAVYLGLDHFNARRNADNFTVANLREACDYAHVRGVKIYITLNIVVFENEVGRALQMAADAFNAGADAFIVQDIGLAMLIKKQIADARLHISTQMNIHNEAGVRACAALGVKRVTLARELSLKEIQNLCKVAKSLGIEVETFGHGAICVSYSGQCMMSSMIGGRSANRGTCAQACRLNYQLNEGNWQHGKRKFDEDDKRGNFLLSPKDYCTAEILPDLAKAGVKSIKIEGRMKSPDYVYGVTSVYRKLVDRAYSDAEYYVSREELQQLKQVFSRGFTSAYMTGQRGNEMMSYTRPNNRGVAIGRVSFSNRNKVEIQSKQKITEGDVLEIWTGRGRAIFVVNSKCKISKAKNNSNFHVYQVELQVNANKREQTYVRHGDRVFRTRSADASFVTKDFEPKVTVCGKITLLIGNSLRLEVWPQADTQNIVSVTSNIVEPAKTRAVTEDDVREHVCRTGQTDFEFAQLDVVLDENAGIGFSALHKIRTQALNELRETLSKHVKKVQVSVPKIVAESSNKNTLEICAIATNPACARAAKRAGASVVYVPAANYKRGTAEMCGVAIDENQAGHPNNTALIIPAVNHEAVGTSREALLGQDYNDLLTEIAGKRVLVDNFGDAIKCAEAGASVEIGPHVPATNSHTMQALAAIGADTVWLSPELSISQISKLNTNAQLGLTIVGRQELMITEHCILMSEGECTQHCSTCTRRAKQHYMVDRKGYKFPVSSDRFGRSHIYNSVPLDVCHSVLELADAGISRFMVDCTLMTVEQTAQAVGRAVKAVELAKTGQQIEKSSNCTTGHLFREVL